MASVVNLGIFGVICLLEFDITSKITLFTTRVKMLTTHLNSIPYTKFVLIQDSIRFKGEKLLEYLAKNHAKYNEYETHLFVFEHDFKRYKSKFTNIKCYDFSTNCRNWFGDPKNDLKTTITGLNTNCVIIIDSLVQLMFRYGLSEVYQLLNDIVKNKNNVQQIVTILHLDMLDINNEKSVQYFNHLASLSLVLDENRVSYTYKKGQRKIIRQIEEYRFENERFITETIKKPSKQIIDETIERLLPENLSTFKIGLSDKDKESRQGLILPYLPKENEDNSTGGKIHYAFDDIDDWDEEDPDDDLDI